MHVIIGEGDSILKKYVGPVSWSVLLLLSNLMEMAQHIFKSSGQDFSYVCTQHMVHDMVHDKANEAQNYEVHDVRLAILREARTFVHQSLYFFQSWLIFVFIPCFIGVILRKMEF